MNGVNAKMINTDNKVNCTGCKMCADICPQGAIVFEKDAEGFWYPIIDDRRCNQCGLCEKKCPSLNSELCLYNGEPEVYAAWSKNWEIRYESTSGGVFWEIAKKFIEDGGIVVGARWGDDRKSVQHYIAYNMNELEALRGSKYIQSDMEGCYKKVKKELDNHKKILFCGTPCQNAAMKIYLGREEENIIYFDFICRSINSPLAFEAFVSELEYKYHSKVKSVHLKNKKKGWQSLATQIIFENGEEYLADRYDDLWIQGFIGNDLYTRPSCYECKYRTLPRRTADITVGDFWGIKNETPYNMFRGVSVVLVNSEKGRKLLDNSSKNLILKRKTINDVLPGNFALLKNPPRNPKRDIFFENLETSGFSKSVLLCTENIHKEKLDAVEMFESDSRKYKNRGEIDREQYLYLNFISKNVIHNGRGRIIPYKNCVIDLQKTSRIVIEGDTDLEIGGNLLHGSKTETYIRIDKCGTWVVKHGGYLYYGSTIEIKKYALFETGYFSMHTGSVIALEKRISLGEDVMIGRNVIIIDSDFHQVYYDIDEPANLPRDVIIEDHVWLTSNINVHKGVTIGQGSIIGNQTVVTRNVPRYCVFAGGSVGEVIKENVNWNREPVKKFVEEMRNKKIVLYGYGVTGKEFYLKNKEKVSYIVDNFVKDEKVLSFDEFTNSVKNINRNDYMWVIASPNHFNELYLQVRIQYHNMIVVSAEELQ